MSHQLDPKGYIAERAFNRPLMIEENKARVLANFLETRFLGNEPLPPAFILDDDEYGEAKKKKFTQVHEGVAVIPIMGTLLHRGGFMEAMSGCLSYQGLRRELIESANDASIKAILLDIDSGGGEVEGNFELARLIREINDNHKPVIAISNGSAYSGAYSLGCAAGEFYVTETGGVGSVGVIIQHIDYSKANEARGIKVTNIKAGDHKAWFDSNFPLDPEAQAFLEAEAKKTADMFISHVAIHRNISEDVVRDTQAGLFFGEDAVNNGFVDGISSYYEILQGMTETDFTDYPTTQGENKMFLKSKGKKMAEDNPAQEDPKETVTTQEPETETEDEGKPEEEVEEGDPEGEPEEEMIPVENAAKISEMCSKAGMSSDAAKFIRMGLTPDQVQEKIDGGEEIKRLCKIAGKPQLAESFIKDGLSVKKVQDTLLAEMADDSDAVKVSNKPSAETINKGANVQSNPVLADVEARKAKANKV